MYCPKCGAKLDNSTMFCSYCGATVGKGKSVSVKETQPKSSSGFKKDKLLAIIAGVLILISLFVPFETGGGKSYSVFYMIDGTGRIDFLSVALIVVLLALFMVGKFTGKNRVIPIIGCIVFWVLTVAFAIDAFTNVHIGSGMSKYKNTLSIGFYMWVAIGILEIISVYMDDRRLKKNRL